MYTYTAIKLVREHAMESVNDNTHTHTHTHTPTEVLIPNLVNLDIGDRSGKTALHHAAYNGHTELLSLLMLKGATVKAQDKRDKTPLHLAAFNGVCCVDDVLHV